MSFQQTQELISLLCVAMHSAASDELDAAEQRGVDDLQTWAATVGALSCLLREALRACPDPASKNSVVSAIMADFSDIAFEQVTIGNA